VVDDAIVVIEAGVEEHRNRA
jgi:hypothetical protein